MSPTAPCFRQTRDITLTSHISKLNATRGNKIYILTHLKLTNLHVIACLFTTKSLATSWWHIGRPIQLPWTHPGLLAGSMRVVSFFSSRSRKVNKHRSQNVQTSPHLTFSSVISIHTTDTKPDLSPLKKWKWTKMTSLWMLWQMYLFVYLLNVFSYLLLSFIF